MYAQLIDDVAKRTLAQASDLALGSRRGRSKKISGTVSGVQRGQQVGALIAAKAKALKISGVVFDRGPYAYRGAVEALAEGAREGGLRF